MKASPPMSIMRSILIELLSLPLRRSGMGAGA